MPPVLDRILRYAADEPFADQVLNLVTETTHGHVLADHLLAALLSRSGSPECRRLEQSGWPPEQLRSIIVENIPMAAAPSRPPAKVTAESLDPHLLLRCKDGDDELGRVLVASLTDEVRSVLAYGSALEPLAAAFATEEEAAPFVGPSFFAEDGKINRERFRGNALALIEAVERTSAELGHATISLPPFFAGAARQGLLKNFLAGFANGSAAAVEDIARKIGKTPLPEPVRLSAATASPTLLRYLARVEAMARERNSDVFDEVMLAVALCESESGVIAEYWRTLGVDPRMAARTIGAMKDDSPVNPRPADATPDFAAIYARLCDRIIGQREPIEQVMPLVRRWLSGVRYRDQPAGVALLMGPPGVGKTELSKELAELLFGDRGKVCFVEMSSMTEEHSISRLIGAPPGYVDSGEGILTTWLAENPRSIVLLDEVEKAHKKCFNVVLRLLSEGRIQNGRGQEFDGSGALILLTSNIGQHDGVFERLAAQRRAGHQETSAVADDPVRRLLDTHFLPEFISRLELVVLFNPLTASDYREIARLACEQAAAPVTLARRLRIQVTPESYDRLAEQALLLRQGARGLRKLANLMSDPIVIFQQQHPDAEEVTVAFEGGKFVVRR